MSERRVCPFIGHKNIQEIVSHIKKKQFCFEPQFLRMSQHPILRKSLQLFNSHFSLLLFYGTSLLFLIFKILSRLKKRVGHLKVGSPSLPSPSRVQIGGLHTPSSRPRDQIPPNLISESLLPVPQPAFQLPEAAKSKILMALTHLALNGMDTETPRGPSEAQAPLSARQLNVTRW